MPSRTTPDLLEAVRNVQSNPNLLFTTLQTLQQRIALLESNLRDATNSKTKENISPDQITKLMPIVQRELSSRGRFPLPVDNLRGRLFDPQPALILDFGATTNPSPTLYDPGRLAVFNGAFEYVGQGDPHTWKTITLTV